MKVHEDSLGGIYTVGVTTQDVTTQEEVRDVTVQYNSQVYCKMHPSNTIV